MENKKLTVVQGNELLEGAYSVTLDEMRLLNLALAQIDSRRPQPDILYKLYPKDFQRIFNVNPTSSHVQLRTAAESLMKKPVTVYKRDSRSNKVKTVQLAWFSRLEYINDDDQSAVVVRFGQDVAPYLYELKESFTQMNFSSLAKLDTPFSVRLYGWLIKSRHLSGYKQNGVIEVTLTLEWMREKAGLVGKYADYRDFRQKLLQPTIDRINANTDISVIWEPVKAGRTVTAIKFTYADEASPEVSKPVRPRLPRRPRAVKGSDLEGRWARKCIALMTDWIGKLQEYDTSCKVPVADMRKLADWYIVTGDKQNSKRVSAEISARKRK
ncbi:MULTISPECIES: replication initiation protein [Erwinia]|uniref:replication initiation protein n=1 Tax=Erwinia TaxID=551 RepID=UPI0010714E74|nr:MULTISPECIES: replication initiation protein [Erwinia]MCX0498997.1 replication initiation protein [Erwinia billingiae]QBR48496.1 RepB family plasmid replication initiator protein [Erwinia sp. QL-Z3]